MTGFRARIGFLVPPGNPTVETEMPQLAPPGVSLHYHRMASTGETGNLAGQEARNREMIASLDASMTSLAMVKPHVIALAHTAISYTLGRDAEMATAARLEANTGVRFISAFASVVTALAHLGTVRIALGTPYALATTLRGKALLEANGLTVVNFGQLPDVRNIYEETAERAYWLGRQVDHADADAIFLSGTGLPTVAILDVLERDLGKPVISAASATMWNALRTVGVRERLSGYGRLFAE